uniref:receptor protein-tyrosine kinase n=1 Tax=Setaria digitata TaxID=48799 RepID=A0A915Q5D0_9BILA
MLYRLSIIDPFVDRTVVLLTEIEPSLLLTGLPEAVMNETDVILVYLPNGTIKSVRYNLEIKVQKVVHVVLSTLGIDRVSFGYFALRLIQSPVTQLCTNNNDCHWLHSGLTMRHVYNKFFNKNSSSIQLRFELRMRFISKDLQEMYQTETGAFMFLHDQVLTDYLTQVSWKVPAETAIELAALQIRRRLGNQNLCSIESCLNLDELEAEGTLARLLPETMLINMKSKMLRKTLVAAVKRHALHTPTECIFHFMQIVRRITQFDTEIFKASLGMVWKNPLDVMVGMAAGISCTADGRGRGPVLLAKLQHVINLTLSRLDETSEKTVISLKITGSPQRLSITLPTWAIAESLAHLINGYHMLLSQQGSIWTPPEMVDEFKKQEAKVPFLNGAQAFSPIRGANLLIDRSRVTLEELLGDGQFGNVYRGTFAKENDLLDAVAVKVCKMNNETVEKQNFLEEAFIMHRFHHEHIIELIGICIETPIWIVMELAPLGELRQYLLHNTETIDLSIQLLFSQQLSSALLYLHTCKYVHRDIAARNVLLSSPRCVKLSDFGLSRCVEEDNIYTASQGKLPIKWMAPESINYRCFSKATDVWMFGVCMWEIFTYGVKPWQGVRNHNVIIKIEGGERLERPSNCPQVLYDLLLRMWNFEASKRPTIFEVNRYLDFLLDQIDCRVPFGSLTAPSDFNESDALIRQEGQANTLLPVAPLLEVDSAAVPTSTLWRTLEQQRIQSEEDDRWLEEEEEKLLPLPALSIVRAQHSNSLSRKQPSLSEGKDVPPGYEFDRRDDTVHGAVFRVIGAVTNLSKEFHAAMTNGQFSECVQIIIESLGNLFNEASQHISILNNSDQQEVKLVETLLESDLRNLSETSKKVLDEDISKETYEALRKEVLKISHRLAFNCKQFLETIDSARIRSGVAKLQLKDVPLIHQFTMAYCSASLSRVGLMRQEAFYGHRNFAKSVIVLEFLVASPLDGSLLLGCNNSRSGGLEVASWKCTSSPSSAIDVAQEFLNPCADAPSASARVICNQLHEWDRQARKWNLRNDEYSLAQLQAKPPVGSFAVLQPAIPGRSRIIAAELAPITSTPYQCLDLECLCTYLRGRVQAGRVCYLPDGSRLTKAIRKEYRMLTDQERKRFHNALIQLKRSGEFDKLALIHGRAAIALRQIDPSVSLPYWDSVLDNGLPNPEDSVLWTNEFLGTTDASGAVTGGDFANFMTFQGCQYRANYNALEYTHGNVHIFVGGDMYDPYTSGNDPAFYLHHSFVDYIWEMYRQQKQTRYQRENDYSPDNQACSSALHFGSALMRPFTPLRNIDGLSNTYTDNLYEYAPRPTCQSGPTCGSKYLFCDRSHGQPRCVSQVRVGGRCSGFVNDEQVCHNGACVGGRCIATQSTSVRPVTPRPASLTPVQTPVVSVNADCFNENECCQHWAQRGECERNRGYMHEWCKVSCRVCQPSFNPNIECSNHHQNCERWARSGECFRNAKWMRENCRQSCHHCNRTRAEICGGDRRASFTTTRRPRPQKITLHCNSPGCYNENVCCPLWGLQGQCSRNVTWMACNCKVSCGLCIPADYDYGTCNDYHRNCPTWAAHGECDTNAWMLENCRRSCRSCLDQWQLRHRCRINSDLIFSRTPNFVPPINDDFYYDIL